MADDIEKERNLEAKSLFHIIGEGGIITTIGNVLVKISVILSGIIILRYLSIYDYGFWRLILSVSGIMSIVTLPILGDVLMTDMSRELGQKRVSTYKAILKKSSYLNLALGFFAAVILFFGAPIISLIVKLDFTLPLRILSFYFIGIAIERIYSAAFYPHLKYFHIQGLKAVSRAAYLVLVILFVFYFKLDLIGVVCAYVLSFFIPSILYLPVFLKTIDYLKNVTSDSGYSLWKTLKSHAKWALLTDYLDNLYVSLRPWIIGYFLNIEAVAIISLAISLFGEIPPLLPLGQVLHPIIPRETENKERFKLLIERGIKYSMWFYTIVGVVALITIPYVVAALFPKYLLALPLFRILLVSLLVSPFLVITERIFYALKEQKKMFISSIIPRLGGIVVVMPLLLKFLGVLGPIFEHIISSFALAFMRIRFLKKILPEIRFPILNLVKIDATDKMYLQKIFDAIKNRLKFKPAS